MTTGEEHRHDTDELDGRGPWRAGRVDGFEPFPDAALRSSVAERFFAVVERFPGRLALSSPSTQRTYAELGDEVRRLAAGIGARVASPGASVALLADHDGPLVAAILAVLASGNVVVVVDPTAPPTEQTHVIAESAATLILHDEAHASDAQRLSTASDRVVPAERIDAIGGEPGALPELTPDDPAMLAFTSGSTGGAKAAVITHGVLLNVVRGATNALGIGPDDRMPMLFPVSLAVAAYPLFLPLLNGGTLATLDVRTVGLAPMPDFLQRERITLAYMAPTVIRFLVDAVAGRTFPDIRMIALGGELVDSEVLRLTTDLFGPRYLAVGYGTTETGVVSLHVRLAAARDESLVPCGHPVDDVDILLLDDTGHPCGADGVGEIAVASPYLFLGYRDHPELTRRVLDPDPMGRPGWGLYRTGDIGRFSEGGELVVLGRQDAKVKVRGRFVVLGDVEADLHELDEVGDAVVTARPRGGTTELVAYVVPAGDSVVDVMRIREQLLERREGYRVPSRLVVLDELPRLPNGKVDRRTLPDPDAVSPPRTVGSGAPVFAGAHQRVRDEIQAIWAALLPVGAVGPDEDFMALGGDSLLAAQMLVMVEAKLGVIVPMGELVHASTARELAEVVVRLESSRAVVAGTTAAMVQEGDPARPILWFVHDLQGSAYRTRHVARDLGSDQPVWSFESPLLRGEPNRSTSLDTFAARYVEDLRAIQPEGPYWIAGYSFGGICAYEMARQLLREGAEVAFLGVVDVGPGYRGPNWREDHSPPWPWFGLALPPPEGTPLMGQLRHYRDMVRTSPLGTARHLMVRSGMARHVDPLRFRSDLRRHGRVRAEWRLWYSWEEHWRLATRDWDRLRPYVAALDLFWADQTGSTDGTMGWGPLVSDLRIHRFPGFHDDLLEEAGSAPLAAVLRTVLDERIATR